MTALTGTSFFVPSLDLLESLADDAPEDVGQDTPADPGPATAEPAAPATTAPVGSLAIGSLKGEPS